MMRITGTILLAIGFAMLAGAVLIRDPIALDANIGAGALSLFGLPIGGLGLLFLLVDAVVGIVRRRRAGGASTTRPQEVRRS